MRCCLGFVGSQSGVLDLGVCYPSESRDNSRFPAWLLGGDKYSKTTLSLTNANDDERITDSERETRIAEIFRQNGDEITFIN